MITILYWYGRMVAHLLNTNHLKVFHGVAQNLSFSKAANQLYTSQSSVSIQIKKLEDSIGLKLFEQLGKSIYLTEAGNILYSYTQKVFALIDEATQAINEIKGFSKGKLLIGSSTTPGIYLLPKIIGKFITIYPGVVPKLQISNSQHIGEMVSKNLLDFGIIGEEFDYPSDLCIEPWIKDELVLIVSNKHPLASKVSVSLIDLKNTLFVCREIGSSTRSIVENILAKHNFSAKIIMELNNTEAVKQAVSADLGVSIISRLAVVNNPEILTIPIEGLSFSRMLNIICHKGKIFSPSTERFLAFLKDNRSYFTF